ncbi:hypothetical protein CJ030_MR3G005787 [Morella rubra]|uniref:RNase H type-1 domain-containing protein n=1 Tax=Morella rubra TaxID=262757 RepID=A0A6A1W7W1_9ROSI|nr:hypothetical protein CJ030_MR3G005787 [Morella rubra]
MYLVVLCRNSDGWIIQARTSKIVGNNPIKGEAPATRMAFQVATSYRGVEVVVKGDCLNLVNQVADIESIPDWDIAGEVSTIRILLNENGKWKSGWISREVNFAAHNLAKWCTMSLILGDICIQNLPSDVGHCDDAALGKLPT